MKKSKKFVLAALALLAITGLLALAGCKNDSVPETPAAKLVSISVTPSARTVYNVGDEVDHKKDGEIEVTATYDDGTTRTVTGTIITDTSSLTQSAGVQTVTVSYKEGDTTKTTTFTVTVFPKEVKVLTGYTSPNNTGNDCTYVAFGEWPQAEAVNFKPTTDPQSHGIFVDNYYVEGNDKYVKEGANYYKVEPIVWRVLTTSYKAPEGGTVGEILLLAEKILTGGIKWADSSNNYMQSYIRQWLNGNSGTEETSDYNGDAGFLQTAFIESARDKIADTTVDNSAASTTDAGNNLTQADGCSDTTDKIFLLSEQEATNSEYGFGAHSEYDSARIRVTTDYAKATGCGGWWWWLRSPLYDLENGARGIDYYGSGLIGSDVGSTGGGVVPALSISLQ